MPEPIGGIQPFAELARGRATVVYKGYQRDPGRFVLLKVVRPEGGEDEALIARFEDEARLAARVRHPNVVAVLNAGRDGLGAYLVAEFVEGLDLRALVARGALPAALAAYVLAEAARGLDAVHAEGILHRDLKPANLLVSEDGAVKLTDFGLASLAPSGEEGAPAEVRGTLAYLAPEVVRGDPPGRAADLFALGALLAEMLTGRPAFARDTDGATLDAVLHHDSAAALIVDPRIPTALADLAGRLLAKDPQHRPQTASALLDALGPIRTQHPADAADLAAFLRDPSSYVPPQPVAELPAESPAEPSAVPAQPVVVERVEAPRRRMWWGVAAGVLAAAALGLATVLTGPLSRDDASQEVSPPAPIVAAVPDSADADVPPLPDEASIAPDGTLARDEAEQAASSPADVLPDAIPEAGVLNPAVAQETEPVAERSDESLVASTEPNAETTSEPLPGTLRVAAEPWARVRIDGELRGTTPLAALTLPAGTHTVTFENPEFPTHTVRVEVGAGEEERLAVSLWQLVGRVELVVSPWAEVAVDGRVWDTVPPQQRPLILTPGEHRLTFTHPALGTREISLRIAAGESRTLRVNLAEGRP
ncbi:MAG: protein kinase [Rhodothermales bacterium]